MAKPQKQLMFAAIGGACACGRCGAPCQVNPVPGSKAKWLKAADKPQGLCINCAVHDHVRRLYPTNLILAQSAGRTLLDPGAQRLFWDLAVMHGVDAKFEDVDWGAIVAKWDLPFPSKLRRSAQNPVTEEELAMARLEGEQRRAGTYKEPMTEEEYQAQRQAAIDEFLGVMHKESHEDSSADHRDRD